MSRGRRKMPTEAETRGMLPAARAAKEYHIAHDTILRYIDKGVLRAEYVQQGNYRTMTLVYEDEVRTLKGKLHASLPRISKVVGTSYRSNGCVFHNDCFTCPFPDCVIDNAKWRINPGLVRMYKDVYMMRKTHDRASTAYVLDIGVMSVDKYERIGEYLERCVK
jgi:hypothetical protein